MNSPIIPGAPKPEDYGKPMWIKIKGEECKPSILKEGLDAKDLKYMGIKNSDIEWHSIITPPVVPEKERRLPTIDELKKILSRNQEAEIEILPNGEIRAKDKEFPPDVKG